MDTSQKTHILETEIDPIPFKRIKINNDGIGFVEHYDFSRANLSENHRKFYITKVASICYQNPKALGSISLYNRLACEAGSLPSSSFEFVPMLIPLKLITDALIMAESPGLPITLNITKFGEWITPNLLLTNFRAVVYDFEQFGIDLRSHFNTEDECDIIAKHYHVFNFKVDLATRAQMVRHRVNWQELSRRYVSGSKVAFDFYISPKLANITSSPIVCDSHGNGHSSHLDTPDIIDICLNHYNAAISSGVKPEEARRILPQAMYTQIWGGFQPSQLANFFKLRLDQHAQTEIRAVAQAMQSLIGATDV